MTVKCLLSFADDRLNFGNQIHFQNLLDAIHHASLNLELRFGIVLCFDKLDQYGNAIVTVSNLDDLNNFHFGNRLRGISAWMIKNCDFNYKDYLVGKRLLYYRRI